MTSPRNALLKQLKWNNYVVKLVAIVGSPRRGGNTETLLDRAIEEAKKKGAVSEKIVLNNVSIKPCQECGGCLKTGTCVITDDMAGVYNALNTSNIIIVASPIFFGNISAQTKIMVDRMQCRWVGKYLLKQKPQKKNKRGAFISCEALKTGKYFECAKMVIDIFFKVQDVEYKEEIFVAGADGKGDVLKQKGILESVDAMVGRLMS